MATYDSDESEAVYGYAADDGRILSQKVTYCDCFLKEYEDYIRRMQMTNPGKSEQIATKERYYWKRYSR